MEGDRLPPLAHLRAAEDVEDAHVAELVASGLTHGREDRARLHILGYRDGDVLPRGRVRDHVLVEGALRQRLHQTLDVELEGAPVALEQRWVELPQPACVGRGRLAGMEVRRGRAADLER